MIPHIIEGFHGDCNKLFINFAKESTVRFATFVKVWQEMKFSLVFSGRGLKEVIYFTSEALQYVIQYFNEANSFLQRVFSIYLLYGLYYRQPIREASKISISLQDWLQIKEFLMIIRENNHSDVMYVLSKLIFDNAFEFATINKKIYTPLPVIVKRSLNDLDNIDTNVDHTNLNEIFNVLNNVEKEYKNAKINLSETLKIPYLNYASDKISEELQNMLKTEPEVDSEKSDDIKKRRRRLKMKGFQNIKKK